MSALTQSEIDVLIAISQGKTLKEIAANRGCSDSTVMTLQTRAFKRLKITSRFELGRRWDRLAREFAPVILSGNIDAAIAIRAST